MLKTKKIHFLGIGGSGISGVADLARKMGYGVSGCDLETGGHSPDHLEGMDLLIVTPAVFYQDAVNPEVLKAQERKILMTWQEFVGKILLKDKKLICIAGTHGKSTTTAMAAILLIDNGFDPTVIIGAKVPEWGGNSRFGQGKYALVEADEFNNNFLNYKPDIAVINNIEFDHPDFFKDEKEVRESFDKFIGNLKGEKILITEKDRLNKHFDLKVLGEHNQKNANMVFVLGQKLGIEERKIIKSLESFEGIGRRMELVGQVKKVKVYDDYAHHPSAIRTTLKGLRSNFSEERIVAIIEPHGYKRTKVLLAKYKGVFDSVDKVIIGPIFPARDEVDASITPQKIARVSDHPEVVGCDSLVEILENLKKEIEDYDVIVVMGAGKSDRWAREVLKINTDT
jgi:UDP-N-acetylmuramate--alanine ligase